MKKAFTLVEMLVVIGIISILTAASLVGYQKMLVSAEKTKTRELVSNTATAIAEIYQNNGSWPRSLRNAKQENGVKVLDGKAAYALVKNGVMSLEVDKTKEQTKGLDRFGILSPYAARVVKRLGSKATESSKVGSDTTVADHRLRFEIDLDGDGLIEDVNVGGETLTVRANVMVWCCGRDGKILPFAEGVKTDDVHSWQYGQVVK
ncbi:MAG: type II secretion system protein [Kiritimatiellae bacterium]|nr:type II secretion system protein [Kiritimatiellia bacterium]